MYVCVCVCLELCMCNTYSVHRYYIDPKVWRRDPLILDRIGDPSFFMDTKQVL